MIVAEDDVSLESALADYFECLDRGEAVDEASLLLKYPQHAAELQNFFTDQRQLNAKVRQLTSKNTASNRLKVRCPNCHQPTEVAVDSTLTDLKCLSCGSRFNLVDRSAVTTESPSMSTMGRFALIERLGMGAFGSVWKARDNELDRIVAIKIPRQGGMTSEEQEKFFREARAAAQLRHPNIVSVHEVGRDGNSVYIVSDFVRGVTLADWLTGEQPTGREAAELCATIADALQHAHDMGVVHRDLKPANIMMDGDCQPHLTDFGLARRETGEVTMTMDGHMLGTPAYMSPEQAEGKAHAADRRSDVYSLGVILFQLLTGELPFRGNARMIMHQVIHDEPPSPRKLYPNVKRDLETITLKCLEKDPVRRYSSAKHLKDELQRFLAGEPILARPISNTERGFRWVKRNRTISALTLSVVFVLLCGILVSTYFAIDASRQANVARQRETEAVQAKQNADTARRNAEGVTAFLVNAFESPDPLRDGRTITIAEVLDRAEDQLNEKLPDQLLVRASLLNAIGSSRLGLGIVDDAVKTLESAVSLRRDLLGPKHPDTLTSMNNLGNAYYSSHRNVDAIALFEKVSAGRRETLGPDHPDTLTAIHDLTVAYNSSGHSEKAIKLHESNLEIRRRVLGTDHADTLRSLYNLARTYHSAGRPLSVVLPMFEEVLQARRRCLGPEHFDTLRSLNHLGDQYLGAAKYDKAIETYKELVSIRRRKLGPDHPTTLNTMYALGRTYVVSGRVNESIAILGEILTIERAKLGDDHYDTRKTMTYLGSAYVTAGQWEQAAAVIDEFLAARHKQSKREPMNMAVTKAGWVSEYHEGALRLLAKADKTNRERDIGIKLALMACELTDYENAIYCNTLAAAYADKGDFNSAIEWSDKAIELASHTNNAQLQQELQRALEDYKAKRTQGAK